VAVYLPAMLRFLQILSLSGAIGNIMNQFSTEICILCCFAVMDSLLSQLRFILFFCVDLIVQRYFFTVSENGTSRTSTKIFTILIHINRFSNFVHICALLIAECICGSKLFY